MKSVSRFRTRRYLLLILIVSLTALAGLITFAVSARNEKRAAKARSVEVTALPAAPVPGITATLSHSPAGPFNLNDTITYTATISNGGTDALGVNFSDTPDANTTFVGGSIKASPIALNDSYTATGNVSIIVPVGSGVLANDYLGLNPVATITAFDATSTQGGAVAVNGDGSFTYTPPGNFTGTDTFTYTLSNSTGSSIGGVTIGVADRIMFVSATGAGSTCRPATPCTLATGDGIALISSGKDLVFVESGTYSSAAFSLNSGQTIAGQAISIGQALTDAGITLAPNSQTLSFAASTTPILNNSATIVTLSSNNLVEDLSINPSGGSGIFANNITTGTTTVRDLTVGATGAANGVNLTSNTGSTFNFSNIGITAVSGTGFSATGGGTVNATQNNTTTVNTLSSTGGTGLQISNTTIGASGLTFRSISSGSGSNSAPSGIILDTTGSTGGLTVVGNGSAGTGGTIQHKTGADGSTTQGSGIFLNSTAGVSLDRMQLNDFQNFGIRGTSVTGFTLNNTIINGTNGTTSAGGSEEGAIRFDGLFTTGPFAAAQTASISNSTLGGTGGSDLSFSDDLRVINSSGTLNRLTITNTNFGKIGINGNNGLTFSALNNGTVMNLTVQDSFFTNAIGSLASITFSQNSTMDVVVRRNKFSNNNVNQSSGGGGLVLQGGSGASTVTYDISCNKFQDAIGIALLVAKGNGSGTIVGDIINNTVGVSGVALSGSTQASGIKVKATGSGTHTVMIRDNVVHQTNEEGIFIQNNDGSATLNASAFNNVVDQPGSFSFAGLNVDIGALGSDTSICNVVVGSAGIAGDKNDFSAGDPANFSDVNLSQQFTTQLNLSKNGSASVTPANVIKDDNLNPATTNTGVSGTVNLVGTLPATPPTVAACTLPPIAQPDDGVIAEQTQLSNTT